MIYKPEIRHDICERRKHLDDETIHQCAEQVAAQLIFLPQIIDSQHIAYYIASDGELDPNVIIHCEQHVNKHYYLPVIDFAQNKKMDFYAHHRNEPLHENRYGILEPQITSQRAADINMLDIIFVPLVAFDKNCNRLGRGAGYYDRALAHLPMHSQQTRPLLVGLAYEFQKIPEFEPKAWDVPLDMVVTECGIYRR